MPIVYPLSLPTIKNPASVTFRGRTVTGRTVSVYTLVQNTQVFPGQRWEATVTLPTMNRAEAADWLAFLLSLNGYEGTFLLGDSLAAVARGIATGTPLVKGASQTGKSLITDGWTISQSGILLKADFIQLGTSLSSRLHMILNNAASDGAGDATLDLWPNLRESPADNAAIVVASPQGVFRLDQVMTEWDEANPSVYPGMTFTCVEDV